MTAIETRIEKFDGDDKFVEVWPCAADEIPERYRVLRQYWNDDYTERRILEWEARA